jgi:chromosome partitioning protein
VIKLVVSNQKGGVAKTTTVLSMARYFADQGRRVLVIDTDPQGCVAMTLGLKPERYLSHFVIHNHTFQSCLTSAGERIDIIASNRETVQAEAVLLNVPAREMSFSHLFSRFDVAYDVVLIDVAPSINMMQTCAMVYARQMLIPISMDTLSLQGAVACLQTAQFMNEMYRVEIKPVAFLPVMMDKRFQMTALTLDALTQYSTRYNVPVLPGIRTDQTVVRCARAKQFLSDFDPKSKAWEDYTVATGQLAEILNGELKPSEKASVVA